MVKSKKMSKSTIAVIVLAILLALSLILGMSGAWFTDSANKNGTGTITFGTIGIKDNGTEVKTAQAAYENFLPGDTIAYSAKVDLSESTVDAYVFVGFVAGVKIGDNKYTELYNEKSQTNLLTMGELSLQTSENASAGWAAVAEQGAGYTYTDTNSGTTYVGKVYKVTVATGKIGSFSATFALAKEANNVVYGSKVETEQTENAKIVLNSQVAATPSTASLELGMYVSAIQAKNLIDESHQTELAQVVAQLGLTAVPAGA